MKEIRQITLVAFYGEKKKNIEFWKKIEKIQNILETKLNLTSENYVRYLSNQIHGTIIGLEASQFNSSIISKNFLENQNMIVELDLLSILENVYHSDLLPFELKIGGFENKDYSFTSRSLSPFDRSISIQGKIIVTMGWPFSNETYIPVLDTIRRRLSRFGGLHKYHSIPDSYDNDFFFVLGNLVNPLEKEESKKIRKLIQEEMQKWNDTRITIRNNDLGIVAYKDTKLKEDPKYYTIEKAIKSIHELKKFYPKYENAIKTKDWLD